MKQFLTLFLLLTSILVQAQIGGKPTNAPANGLYNLGRRGDGILLEIGKTGNAAPVALTPYISTASLRASTINTGAQMPTQVNITDPRRQGVFAVDVSDKTTPDNGGTVIVTAGGLRYKRIFTNAVDVGWFTASNGITDDRANLQKAIDVAATSGALIVDTGRPTYKVTGSIRLKRDIAGFNLTGALIPVGSGYTVLITDTAFNWTVPMRALIRGTGNTVNGIQLNNPQRSVFASLEVFNLNGFGLKIVNAWDCTFITATAENCGNASNYAYSLESNGDTSNMTTTLRLQVERAHEKAIYIDPVSLSCRFNNIHSEQAHVSGSVKNTWFFGGGSCTYSNLRLQAQDGSGWNSSLARVYFDLTFSSADDIRVEGNSPVQAESSSSGDCYLRNVLFPSFERVGAGQVYVEKGKILSLRGVTPGLHVSDVASTKVDVGFSALSSQALDYRGGSIGTLTSSNPNARITCTGTTISGGKFAQAETRLINSTFTLGTQTVGPTKVYLNNSKLVGNLTTNSGHFEFINNSVINGNLSCGEVLSIIFDASSYVTGTVTGYGPPTSSQFAGGFSVGQRTWNPAPTPKGTEWWTCTAAGKGGQPGTWTAH